MATEKKRITKLIDQLDEYDESYYNDGVSLVSDTEYDGIKDELEVKFKSFKATTKTDKKLYERAEEALIRIGAPPPKDGKWPKVVHEVAMGSLRKENTPEEMEKWFTDIGLPSGGLFVGEKLDGCSIDLKYENGELVRGATRGNGEVGQDITRNVKKMTGVPLKIKDKLDIHVRGEMVLRKTKKKKYFSDMKTERNAANGIAGRVHGTGPEHLDVMCYNIEGKQFDTEKEAIEYIKGLGFGVPNWKLVKSISAVVAMWQKYMDGTRENLDYLIDGLVVSVNDMAKQVALGEYSSGKPQGARAFKFDAPEVKTKVIDKAIQVGDTGQITPVCIVEPVDQRVGAGCWS
jgi:DNA ligase (NAD+)